jgi:4-hydroxy-3-methylbut-2-enyl diphosphate reductase
MHGRGNEVVMIGHKGHPEVEGTMGQVEGEVLLVQTAADVAGLNVSKPMSLAYVTQTTLSVDDVSQIVGALRQRFPEIRGPKKDDICYATQNRQDAVKKLAEHCQLIIVVGSPNSSNSNRLREVAEKQGVAAYMVDRAEEIQESWLAGVSSVGVSAGASAPERLVRLVIERLQELGAGSVSTLPGISEGVTFPLPKEVA